MGVVLHPFLPASGDSRTDPGLDNAVGVAGSRAAEGGAERVPDIGYIAPGFGGGGFNGAPRSWTRCGPAPRRPVTRAHRLIAGGLP